MRGRSLYLLRLDPLYFSVTAVGNVIAIASYGWRLDNVIQYNETRAWLCFWFKVNYKTPGFTIAW